MNKNIWIVAVKAVAADKVAVLARLKDVRVELTVQPAMSPMRLLVKVGAGEPLVEVLDGLAQFQARHLRASGSSVVQIVYEGNGADNAELLALVGTEVGLVTGRPVVTVPENGKWLVLFDPADRVRVGTIITEKPDGWEPEHQGMQKRLRCGMWASEKDIPLHPEDQRYAEEKLGNAAPVPLTLRQLLEKVLGERQ